jgi:hypothetical protein
MKPPYKIPQSLVAGFKLVRALRSNEHWAVYIALMKHDGCRFDKFVEYFGSNYHEMKMILDDLEQGGLVEGFTIWDEELGGDLARYYYRVTIDGYRFYYRICESLFPTRDISRWNQIQKWTQNSLAKIRSQIEIEREATFLPKATKRVNLKIRSVIHE